MSSTDAYFISIAVLVCQFSPGYIYIYVYIYISLLVQPGIYIYIDIYAVRTYNRTLLKCNMFKLVMDGQYHMIDLLPTVIVGQKKFDACLLTESIM